MKRNRGEFARRLQVELELARVENALLRRRVDAFRRTLEEQVLYERDKDCLCPRLVARYLLEADDAMAGRGK